MRRLLFILLLGVYAAAVGCSGASSALPTVDRAPNKPPIGDKKAKTQLPTASD